MRVILDVNVLVSAFITRGVARTLLDLWRKDQRFELVVCPMLLDELSRVLRRDRFRAFVAAHDVDQLLSFLEVEALLVGDPTKIERTTDDPDDDYLVALALQEDVAMLVSGDRDLVEVAVPGVTVATPRQALDLLHPAD